MGSIVESSVAFCSILDHNKLAIMPPIAINIGNIPPIEPRNRRRFLGEKVTTFTFDLTEIEINRCGAGFSKDQGVFEGGEENEAL
jgi:hypothetical protein